MVDLSALMMSYSSGKRIPKEEYPKRVYELLIQNGYQPDSLQYIHITGSKGKGSLAYNCFELLKYRVDKVGLFLSPHIFDIRERFVTQNGMISEQRLQDIFNQYNSLFQEQELHFFEICLFCALIFFLEEECEFVVLEVGVGGRFDPTNFCMPQLSLLGQVSLEHTEFLGDTIEKIAYDKAGIIKNNIPAFSVAQENCVKDIFLQEGDVRFIDEISTITNINHQGINGYQFDLEIDVNNKIAINNIILNRIGVAHITNFVLAVAGICHIFSDYDINDIRKVAQKKIPYRMDKIEDFVLVDTAHNDISFANLMNGLNDIQWNDVVCYFTLLQGKELDPIVDVLKQFRTKIKKIIFYDFEYGIRKSNAYEFYLKTKQFIASEYCATVDQLTINKSEKNVFAGSFYSIPKIMQLIREI